MESRLSDQELHALGLNRAQLGEGDILDWPEDVIAHGAALRPALAVLAVLVASQFANHHFLQTTLGVVEGLAARLEQLEEEPRILKLVGPPGATLTVQTPRETTTTESFRPDPNDPATVYMDLRATNAVRVTFPGGNGLVVEIQSDGIVINGVFSVEPLAGIDSEVAHWCGERQEDWLQQEIQHRLARQDPWQHAVAIGLFARFGGAVQPAREIVTGMLEHRVDPDLARPRQWARGLNPAQIRTLELLARAEIDRLHAAIDELWELMACDEPAWQQELLDLCRGRDDVEGIRLLLVEAKVAERIADDIGILDQAGERFMQSLPVVVAGSDARLARARSLGPGDWWAAPVVESDGSDNDVSA